MVFLFSTYFVDAKKGITQRLKYVDPIRKLLLWYLTNDSKHHLWTRQTVHLNRLLGIQPRSRLTQLCALCLNQDTFSLSFTETSKADTPECPVLLASWSSENIISGSITGHLLQRLEISRQWDYCRPAFICRAPYCSEASVLTSISFQLLVGEPDVCPMVLHKGVLTPG